MQFLGPEEINNNSKINSGMTDKRFHHR